MASARFKGGKMALSVELHKKFKGFQMDVAFEHDGGSLGILGGSGMGKSMTLKMIAGLVKPDSGKVIVDLHPRAHTSSESFCLLPAVHYPTSK